MTVGQNEKAIYTYNSHTIFMQSSLSLNLPKEFKKKITLFTLFLPKGKMNNRWKENSL